MKNKKLEIVFQPNLEDTIDAKLRLTGKLESTKKKLRESKNLGLFSLVTSLVAIIYLIYENNFKSKSLFYLYLFGIFILFLNFLYSFFTPWIWKRRVSNFIKEEFIQDGETRISLNKNGIESSSKSITVNYLWEEIGEINKEQDLIELYFTKKGIIILREKYFPNKESYNEFLNQLKELLPEPKRF